MEDRIPFRNLVGNEREEENVSGDRLCHTTLTNSHWLVTTAFISYSPSLADGGFLGPHVPTPHSKETWPTAPGSDLHTGRTPVRLVTQPVAPDLRQTEARSPTTSLEGRTTNTRQAALTAIRSHTFRGDPPRTSVLLKD